jgi:3-dehydroquinate dehydratase type I
VGEGVASRLLISLGGADLDLLSRRLAWLQGRVGLVEFRLDLMPEDADLAALVAAAGELKVVAACRLQAEGGALAGDAAARRARLEQAAAQGVAFVDQPVDQAAWPVPKGVGIVHSWHAPREVGEDAAVQLAEAHALAASRVRPGDVIKLVTWADSSADSAPVLALQAAAPDGSLVGFSQGPGSAASRLLCLRGGAPWTYLCWPGEETAPGQWSLAQVEGLPRGWESAETPLVGVAGDPIDHSWSPFLWQRAGQLATPPQPLLDLPLRARDLAPLLDAVEGWGMRALSLTMPLKEEPAALAARGPEATEDAVNWMVAVARAWASGNSDGEGAHAALAAAGMADDASWLVLGSGGAARGLVAAARRHGHPVRVAARRPLAWFPEAEDLATVDLTTADVVLQATSLGSRADPGHPTPGRAPRADALAMDLIYEPLETAWSRDAAAAGATVLPGTAMLLHQMLAPFRRAFPDAVLDDAAVARLDADFAAARAAETAVVLLGPRASGKSTLGRALAARLGWRFVDADEALEAEHGRRIADWIGQDLAGFRAAEAALLPRLLGRRRTVVALGGGAVESSPSVDLLAAHPRVLGLRAEAGVRIARQQAAPRPALVAGGLESETARLDARRRDDYARSASAWVDSDCPLQQTVDRALEALDLRGFGPT